MTTHSLHAFRILKYSFGSAALIAGFDKFFHYLTPWMASGLANFLTPFASLYLGTNVTHILYALGAAQIIIGLLLLSKFTKIGAYAMALGLFGLAGISLYFGRYSMALHYIVLACGGIALVCLAKGKNLQHLLAK